MSTNGEDYADKIANLIVNSLGEQVCVYFAKELDFYGDFCCSTCPLRGKCNDAEKLEEWLKDEKQE